MLYFLPVRSIVNNVCCCNVSAENVVKSTGYPEAPSGLSVLSEAF